MQLDTPLRSTDSLVSPGDDNVAVLANANEVTETKHNNKNDAAATMDDVTTATSAATESDMKGPVTNADNDKMKNGSSSNISDARENYKFDVSTTHKCRVILHLHVPT